MRGFLTRTRRSRRSVIALVTVVGASVAIATAFAAFPDTDVETFTGCVNTGGSSGGQVSQVALGLNPLKPCGNNQRLIRLGGGDITKVTAGAGLSATPTAGDNGAVVLAIVGGYSLPQACSAGQVPMQISGSWTCANLPDPSIWTRNSGNFILDGASDGEVSRSFSLSLPAGTYFVTLTGTAYNVGSNDLDALCFVSNTAGEPNFGGTLVADGETGGRAGGGIAGSGIVSDTNAFTVSVTCGSFTAGNSVNVTLSALRVGTVTDQTPSP